MTASFIYQTTDYSLVQADQSFTLLKDDFTRDTFIKAIAWSIEEGTHFIVQRGTTIVGILSENGKINLERDNISFDRYNDLPKENITFTKVGSGICSLIVKVSGFSGEITLASLYLDFVNEFYLLNSSAKTFEEAITFSRVSQATYFDENGVLQVAATDVHRLTHDPENFSSLGFLNEGSITNFVGSSETLVAGGSRMISVNLTLSAASNPLTATSVTRVIANATAGTHQIRAYYGNAGATGWHVSPGKWMRAYVKAVGPAGYRLAFVSNFNDGSTESEPILDFETGLLDATLGQGLKCEALEVSEGVWRVDIYGTTSVDSQRFVGFGLILPDNTQSFAGDDESGFDIWGWQIEEALQPSSFIPTTGVAATRASDITNLSLNTAPDWFNGVEGTLLVEFPWTTTSSNSYLATFWESDAGAEQRMLRVDSDGTVAIGTEGDSDISTVSLPVSPSSGDLIKVALAYSANMETIQVAGGGVVGTEGTANSALVPSSLFIGRGLETTKFGNTPIRTITYFPRRMTSDELEEETL